MNSSTYEGIYMHRGEDLDLVYIEKNHNNQYTYRYRHNLVNQKIEFNKLQKWLKAGYMFKCGDKSLTIMKCLYE